MHFSTSELATIANALTSAASRYRECAKTARATPGFENLGAQFDKQVAEVTAIHERIMDESEAGQ